MATDPFLALPTKQRILALIGEDIRLFPAPEGLLIGVAQYNEKNIYFAATLPEIKTGTLGVNECNALTEFVTEIPERSDAFIFLIDSAGARLDDGLPIQGALRKTMRALIDARLNKLASVAILGRNVFGGASLLAYALSNQFYSIGTRMAMTGPRVLQKYNRLSEALVLDKINGTARCQQSNQTLCNPGSQPTHLQHWLDSPKRSIPVCEESLRARLAAADLRARTEDPVLATPRTLVCQQGVTPGAADLIKLAETIKTLPSGATIELGWSSHSIKLEDEAVIQSEYLSYLSMALRQRTRNGVKINLHLTGEVSGGLFIALAAAATQVGISPKGKVLTLPPYMIKNIFKSNSEKTNKNETPLNSGAVDFIIN